MRVSTGCMKSLEGKYRVTRVEAMHRVISEVGKCIMVGGVVQCRVSTGCQALRVSTRCMTIA